MNSSMTISKIVGILFLLLGLIYLIVTFRLADASIGSPYAPKIFPAGLAILMIGFSIAQLIKEFRVRPESGSRGAGIDVENITYIGLTTLCALLYVVLFDRLGYVLSTILFLEGLLSVFNGAAKWKQNTIVAVSFSLVVYILFFKLLNVYLPPFPFFE